jgi:hypothetical protein
MTHPTVWKWKLGIRQMWWEQITDFLKKILKKICSSINDNGTWHIRYNHKLYQLYEELEIVNMVKAGRLRWLGHLSRSKDMYEPLQEVNFYKAWKYQERGTP